MLELGIPNRAPTFGYVFTLPPEAFLSKPTDSNPWVSGHIAP